MTDTEAKLYMRQKGYFDRLIKPELGCNKGTIYEDRLVGNSPELNPLDCSLFADLTNALTMHICLTDELESADQRKFTLTSPDRIEHAIDRLWSAANGSNEQFPSSDRIKTDIF